MTYQIQNGDCIEVMKSMPDNSVDSIVTDPPYELGFMGKSWDSTGIAFNVEVWKEALRILKPGGHLLAFSGSRTYHRMAVAIEDAGFEIRDQIMWVYGSGFPKSLNISKAIDKSAGAPVKVGKRFVVAGQEGNKVLRNPEPQGEARDEMRHDAVTEEAKQWQGWGTALKPAHEPIVMARKPLIGTVAANVLEYGTGGLNIEASRVPSDDGFQKAWDKPVSTNISADGGKYISEGAKHTVDLSDYRPTGRFPANLIHDGSDEVVELFGEAQRFFYCAKTSKRDRNEGLDEFEEKQSFGGGLRNPDDYSDSEKDQGLLNAAKAFGAHKAPNKNFHPTVKPTDLMRYLCRLVTPPNGVILDPFMGSGSTGKGAIYEDFNFIGIEMEAEYVAIAKARIDYAVADKAKRLM